MLLFTVAGPLSAQEASVVTRIGPRSISVAVELDYRGEQVLESLAAGMRSEITFSIRLYQPVRGPSRLLGDRLIAEYHPSFTAHRDPFTREYVIESAVGTQRRISSADVFLEEFFSLAAFPVPTNTIDDLEYHYLMCQVELRPVRLVPALDFLGAVRPGDTVVTPWRRVDLQAFGGAT
ncbi:MAG: hypothetical protein EA384_13995 [Spirochaetaceae bacterium]|nr:MAG: hypothetical protein EA384_13995 [Spirochaetaceae bacterium]